MAKHNEIGKQGEELAVDYLKNKGFTILERNYRFKRAEIDIIGFKDEFLVAVEVKTRSTTYFGDPQDFVKSGQIQRLVMAINQFAEQRSIDAEIRFDIIAIILHKTTPQIQHFENAFYHF
ncbi:YraN family protein [Zunongwangia sp.]|uniref:YraN family protein n=1 Tax=Zunongwangia sp. TaxID=1965325 RepID=UPI003AA8B537